MFLYFNGCDEDLNPWFKLFTDLFQKGSADQIVLTFNRIINSPKSSELENIAIKVFRKISEKFALQYSQIQNMSMPISSFQGE